MAHYKYLPTYFSPKFKFFFFFSPRWKKKTKPFLLKFKGPTFNKFYIFCQDGFVSAERETAGLIRWSSNLTVCFLYLAVTSYLRFATCLSSVLIPLNILYQIFCVRFQFSYSDLSPKPNCLILLLPVSSKIKLTVGERKFWKKSWKKIPRLFRAVSGIIVAKKNWKKVQRM